MQIIHSTSKQARMADPEVSEFGLMTKARRVDSGAQQVGDQSSRARPAITSK
jgi:hypothetical protein